MTGVGPVLNFYIDKDHFPYRFKGNYDFADDALMKELGGCNTWLLWTLRTYVELRNIYECKLTDKMPESGIVFFFRGSVSLTEKPNENQFWVCMVADTTWHPYSHVNLFQNAYWTDKYPQSHFIRHWPQLNIIKSNGSDALPENIAYFGDSNNLAAELKSKDWADFTHSNGYMFKTPPSDQWNDYSNIDLIIGIRSFDNNERYLSKPSSKLINAWRANAVYIGGNESATVYEKRDEFDFIQVTGYEDLKKMLLSLKHDEKLFARYKMQTANCGERFPDSFFVNQWTDLIENQLMPLYNKTLRGNAFSHGSFIARRFSIYKWEALKGRVSKLFTAN